MRRHFLHAKIHRATVTATRLDYEGSLSIDPELMRLAGIAVDEQVHVVNVSNGERLVTYAIEGKAGEMVLNGAAAHKGAVGDLVIVMTFAELDESEIAVNHPQVIHVDERNRPLA